MITSTLLVPALLAAFSTALPTSTSSTQQQEAYHHQKPPTNFYLVTTTSPHPANSSKLLPNASAISLYDPGYAPTESLRTIAPGYNSLPTFNFSLGQLHTISYGPHNTQEAVYNSTGLTVGSVLGFAARPATKGVWELELLDGYLLNAKGRAQGGKGWSLCQDEDESVLFWKGTEKGCVPTYVQAVSEPPY